MVVRHSPVPPLKVTRVLANVCMVRSRQPVIELSCMCERVATVQNVDLPQASLPCRKRGKLLHSVDMTPT